MRQLENVIERAVALETTEAVLPERLPESIRSPSRSEPLPAIGDGFSLDAYLLSVEARLLREALERARGRPRRGRPPARRLRPVLRYLIQKHGGAADRNWPSDNNCHDPASGRGSYKS